MADVIGSLFAFNIFGIPIIPVAVVILLFYFIFKNFKKSSKSGLEKPPNIDVKKLTKKTFDKIIRTHGLKRFIWKNLRIGIDPKGKILRYMFEEHEFKDINSLERVTIPLYLIRTSRLPILFSFFGLGIERYFIRGDYLENFADINLSDQNDLILNRSVKFR